MTHLNDAVPVEWRLIRFSAGAFDILLNPWCPEGDQLIKYEFNTRKRLDLKEHIEFISLMEWLRTADTHVLCDLNFNEKLNTTLTLVNCSSGDDLSQELILLKEIKRFITKHQINEPIKASLDELYSYKGGIHFLNVISETEASRFQVTFSLKDLLDEQMGLKHACVMVYLVPVGNCVLGNVCIFEGVIAPIEGDRYKFNAKKLLSEEPIFISEAKVVKKEELEELLLETSKPYQNTHKVVVLGAKEAVPYAKQVLLEDN